MQSSLSAREQLKLVSPLRAMTTQRERQPMMADSITTSVEDLQCSPGTPPSLFDVAMTQPSK